MGRSPWLLASALTVGLLTASVALAGIPDPALSDVPNVYYSPGGAGEYIVTVNSSEGPVDGATVQLVFSASADALVCWCVGQTHPIIETTTAANGEASFFIGAGGCLDPAELAMLPAVEVFADGIKLAEVGAVSPDATDGAGDFPWEGWNPGGSCETGISDGVNHTAPIASGSYEFCSDVDSDGQVALSDAVTLTVDISTGSACTQQ